MHHRSRNPTAGRFRQEKVQKEEGERQEIRGEDEMTYA